MQKRILRAVYGIDGAEAVVGREVWICLCRVEERGFVGLFRGLRLRCRLDRRC